MRTEKIQVINRQWTFFYGGSMLNLQCGPYDQPPVSRAQAMIRHAREMEAFRRECDEHERTHFNPDKFLCPRH